MKDLLTKDLANKLPKLYATEDEPLEDKIVMAKFFHPSTDWTWYAVEFDGEDTCWGLVSGFETEFGYFSISELNQPLGPLHLPAERDIFFRPARLKDLAVFAQGGMVF
jgi:hypothetical protein